MLRNCFDIMVHPLWWSLVWWNSSFIGDWHWNKHFFQKIVCSFLSATIPLEVLFLPKDDYTACLIYRAASSIDLQSVSNFWIREVGISLGMSLDDSFLHAACLQRIVQIWGDDEPEPLSHLAIHSSVGSAHPELPLGCCNSITGNSFLFIIILCWM